MHEVAKHDYTYEVPLLKLRCNAAYIFSRILCAVLPFQPSCLS